MIIECPKCQSRYDASQKQAGESVSCRCGVDLFIPKLPNIARSWNCPNCGGEADPNENRCTYCNAYLAYERCPACFSIAPYKDAKFCIECGESLTLPIKHIRENHSAQPCPRCSSILQHKVVDKHLVDVCRDCGGVWLSHRLFDELLRNKPINNFAALGKIPPKGANLVNHEICYLPCPECNELMSRHNFLNDSYIILDQCNTHGIWFDKYELAAVLEYGKADRNLKIKPDSIDHVEQKSAQKELPHTIEIKEEDLSQLLDEFPQWFRPQKNDE